MFKWITAALLLCGSPLLCAAELAIIIDDVGYNLSAGEQLIRLEHDITLAILPFTPHGRTLANAAHHAGKEIMLHTPMSSTRNVSPGKQTLTGLMSQQQLQAALEKMLKDIPHVQGTNNHMGSQLTQEAGPMKWLMEVLSVRQLYFIDSRTTAATVALDTAREQGLPSMKRDVFLDNLRQEKQIRQQLQQAITLAQQQGYAIAIGHPYRETLAVLKQLDSLLADTDVHLVPVSHLITHHAPVPVPALSRQALPPTARYCPAPPPLIRYLDEALDTHLRHQRQNAVFRELFHPVIVISDEP